MLHHENLLRASGFRARLRDVLGPAATYLGTPMSAALFDLAAIDARCSMAPNVSDRWLNLDDQGIRHAAAVLERQLERNMRDGEILPSGSKLRGIACGSVNLHLRTLSASVDQPGLHDHNSLPQAPGGANFRRLLDRLDLLTRHLPCRALGLPRPAVVHYHARPHYLLQWAPFPAALGVVLQREANGGPSRLLCNSPAEWLDKFAHGIVENMRQLWNENRRIAAHVKRAREVGRALARKRGIHFHGVNVDLSMPQTDDFMPLSLEFVAWDRANRPGLVGSRIRDDEAMEHHDGPSYSGSQSTIEEFRRAGADGRIDRLALAIAEASAEGTAAVLSRLAVAYSTGVELFWEDRFYYAELGWSWGTIRAMMFEADDMFSISPSQIRLQGLQVPDALMASAEGRRVHEVVELPFRCEALVQSMAWDFDATCIRIDPADVLYVNCAEGRVWEIDSEA